MWYVNRDKQREGPFSDRQLKDMASSGALRPSDMIWKQGLSGWIPARHVKGLFRASATHMPTVASAAPISNTRPLGETSVPIIVAPTGALPSRRTVTSHRKKSKSSRAHLPSLLIPALFIGGCVIIFGQPGKQKNRVSKRKDAIATTAVDTQSQPEAKSSRAPISQPNRSNEEALTVAAKVDPPSPPLVDIGGIFLGMTLEELKNKCRGLEITEVDQELSQKYCIEFEPEKRAEIVKYSPLGSPVHTWTAADWADYDLGRGKLMASLPAWMNKSMERSTSFTVQDLYATARPVEWQHRRMKRVDPWRLLAIDGGPSRSPGLLLTEVKYHDVHGVLGVKMHYGRSVNSQAIVRAMNEKFSRGKLMTSETRGREVGRIGGQLIIGEERTITTGVGPYTWRPLQGVGVILYTGGSPVLELADTVKQLTIASQAGSAERERKERREMKDLGL